MTFPRVLRGGSWNIGVWIRGTPLTRCARRHASDPSHRFEDGGFRPVAAVKELPRVLHGGSWILDARDVRCADRFAFVPGYHRHSGIYGVRPVAGVKEAPRVIRGGGWVNADRGCRSSAYLWDVPETRYACLGFRPVSDA